MDLEAAREFMREHHRAVLATRRSGGIQQSPVLVNVDGEGRTIISSRDPPKGALVLCIDEKTQIQALDRTQATLPIKPGKAERMTNDYKRNGTTSLYAALEIATGEVTGACYPNTATRSSWRS